MINNTHRVEEIVDTPEMIARCLECKHTECINCIGRAPKRERSTIPMDMNLFIDLYNRHIPTKYMAKSLKVGYNTLVNRLHLLGWDVQPAYRTRKTREDIPGDLTWMFQT